MHWNYEQEARGRPQRLRGQRPTSSLAIVVPPFCNSFCRYIKWIQQNYPTDSRACSLVIERCLQKFGQSALPPGHALPSHLDHLHPFSGFSECEGYLLLHAVARNRNEARPLLSGGDDRVRAELRLRAHGTHLPGGHHTVVLPFVGDVDVRSRWTW